MLTEEEKISPDIILDKPLMPLRDVVVYPHMVIPLFVGREKSKMALERAMAEEKKILLSCQKKSDIDDPTISDINTVGTLANILQLVTLPDGTVKRRRADPAPNTLPRRDGRLHHIATHCADSLSLGNRPVVRLICCIYTWQQHSISN